MRLMLVVWSLVFSVSLFASVESEVDATRFEHKNGTLIDHFSGLQWQDNKAAKTIKRNWYGAKKYCSALTLDGKNDWRLPHENELKYTHSDIKNKFYYLNNNGSYWASSTIPGGFAYSVSYYKTYKNSVGWGDTSPKYNVRCVRGKQYEYVSNLKEKVDQVRNSNIQKRCKPYYIKAKNINTVESYSNFIKSYPFASQVEDARKNLHTLAYNEAKNINTVESYSNFIKSYPFASQVEDARKNLHTLAYNEAKNINTVESYSNFIKSYPSASQAQEALQSLYGLVKIKNNINSYKLFIKTYSKAPQVKDALKNLYNLIKQKNNIAGYEWFIKTYPKAPQVKDAIANIHKLAFNKAKDIDTISAYNTFIISYPMAKEVNQANKLAKELERYKYTDTLPEWVRSIMPDFLADILNSIFGIFSSDEKKSRALLIKAKQIERQGNEYYGDKKAGYMIVANRMYDLLQEEYDDTDATLRFLESEEFKDFVRTFKGAMRRINDRLDNIAHYSSEILEVSKEGFSQSHADSQMAAYHQEEKTKWDKYMHFRDKGYQ